MADDIIDIREYLVVLYSTGVIILPLFERCEYSTGVAVGLKRKHE